MRRWQAALLVLFGTRLAAQAPPDPREQAAALVPAGVVARTVETVEALRAQTGAPDGGWCVVLGYRRPGDGGGGVFRFEAGSEAEADGGAVLAPAQGSGRWRRVVDPEGEAYAEWFGAWGDGDSAAPHDDQAAINACLAAFGRVRLLARTYGVRGKPVHYHPTATYHAVDLAPGYRIEGSGREVTRIRLLDGTNPHGAGPSENYLCVFGNRAFHTSADHIVIRDLTIDGNFDGQNKETTIHAIAIRGGDALVERVNFRGYGTGRNPENGSSRECFVVHQTLVYKDPTASRKAATLRDLDFTDPGHNGGIGPVAEITHIAIGGADNFENRSWILARGADPDWDPANDGENERNWWPSYGGLIERCRIHDVAYDPATQNSPLNGITYGDCIGMVVRGNEVVNFDGAAVFTMSWWNRGTTIVDNTFDGVACGIALHMKGIDGRPNQAPLHEDVLIEGNRVRTGSPPHFPWGPRGLHLYGQVLGEGIRMRHLTVRRNHFAGRAYENAKGERVCPTGIGVQIVHPNYEDLRFVDNVIDMPDRTAGRWIPDLPGCLAMTFFPLARWNDDVASGRVTVHGNVDPAGRPVYPLLIDWSYQNAPTWGRPDGASPVE